MFVKYWIYVCGTMFFFVSFEGEIVLYKVIYMVMFLCCVALYQVKLLLQPELQLNEMLKYVCTLTQNDLKSDRRPCSCDGYSGRGLTRGKRGLQTHNTDNSVCFGLRWRLQTLCD